MKRGPPHPWKTACFQEWRDALRRVCMTFAISSYDLSFVNYGGSKMQKYLPLIVILLALTVLTSVRAQEPTNTWLMDFNKAKKEAAEKNLPILADFSGCDWCGWCIKLDKEVFDQKEFKAFAMDRLILFRACFPNENRPRTDADVQNEQLLQAYGVEGFPTVLLLDAAGKVIARTGYRKGGAGAYVEHLKDLLKQPANK